MKRIYGIAALVFFLQSGNIAVCQDFSADTAKAMEFYRSGKYNEAAEIFSKWIPVLKENKRQIDTAAYNDLLLNTAECYALSGEYEQAIKLDSESVALMKDRFGDNSFEYAISINNLGVVYLNINRYSEAEKLMSEVVRIFKEKLGENDPDYATSLNNLAEVYRSMGRDDQALPLTIKSTEIDKKVLGPDDPGYGIHLNNLATLYQDMGYFDLAEPLFIEVINIFRKILGQDHPDYATLLSNLAMLYLEMGRYDLAEPLAKEAAQITLKALGKDHPDYSRRLNNLGRIYYATGRYELAEPLWEEAMKIDRTVYGEENMNYTRNLNNLGILYQAMGRYEQAERVMKQALETDTKIPDRDLSIYSIHLNNLAGLYKVTGRYEESEALMKEAILIAEKNPGPEHPTYAIYLNTLAILYTEMGKYEESLNLLTEVLRIDRQKLDKDHPDYAVHIGNLARVYIAMGQYDQAEPLLSEAIDIERGKLGSGNSGLAFDLNKMAILYELKGNHSKSLASMKEAFDVSGNSLKLNSGYLSEKELKQFLETFLYNLDFYQSAIYRESAQQTKDGDFSLDIELFRKGILLRSVTETRKTILESNDSALINSYYTVMSLRKQAGDLYSRPVTSRYVNPDSLLEKANQLEKELTSLSKQYRQSLEESAITWKQVRDKLDPGEAVVEFTGFHYYDEKPTDSVIYCALILRKQDSLPSMIRLCGEKYLKAASPPPAAKPATLNLAYRGQRGVQYVPDSAVFAGGKLYGLVWKPFDNLLEGINTVYYAPSGILNSISFAAIPDADGRLLSDKYNLIRVSSSRSLVFTPGKSDITNAAVFGGIVYTIDSTEMISEARRYHKPGDTLIAFNQTRSGNKTGFDYLLNTLKEADSVSSKLVKTNIRVEEFKGQSALEESFKALSGPGSPSIIHIATHGYYYPYPQDQRKREQAMMAGAGEMKYSYSEDPLLRSGLIMAGANRAWTGKPVPPGVEDGILTAREVSEMDLRHTQLVVLSACQTGLGDVKGSEGVEGLQRAFKMAGVRYLIISLWEVPDKETVEFMDDFYSQWLAGKEIREAFRIAQKQMYTRYPNEPDKWAAFVLTE